MRLSLSVSLTCLLTLSSAWGADQHSPISIRVVNLSSLKITAFSISGMPFRDVDLEIAHGETLTPAFADGQMDYHIYWRLQDGTVHGAFVDLKKELPPVFYGDVVLTIQDNSLSVSWANMSPAWVEYSHAGDPRIVPRPSEPYYSSCAGGLLKSTTTLIAWNEAASRTRKRLASQPELIAEALDRGRCTLSWYIPSAAAGRIRRQLDEETEARLRAEWQSDIEKYKASQSANQ